MSPTRVSRPRPRVWQLVSGSVLVASVAGLAGCGGGGDPLATPTTPNAAAPAAAGAVTVGSADFSESRLLALIYRGALAAKGVNVAEPRLGIGAREAYLKGLEDGSINLIPEYTGALALYYQKDFAQTDPQKVYEELSRLLPPGLTILAPSAAEDKDSITVTKATADRYRLRTVGDLSAVAGSLTLGAPAEFKSRAQGVPGLTRTYGVTFGQVRTLKGQQIVQALTNGQIDAANIFTTDPSITANGFVVLDDDKHLFGAQNIVPLLTKEAAKDPKVTETLNAVSAALTTGDVQRMLTEVDIDKVDAQAVARRWLSAKGLG